MSSTMVKLQFHPPLMPSIFLVKYRESIDDDVGVLFAEDDDDVVRFEEDDDEEEGYLFAGQGT